MGDRTIRTDRRFTLAAGIGGVAAVLTLAFTALRPKDSETNWIRQLYSQDAAAVDSAADELVRLKCTRAIPDLLWALTDRDDVFPSSGSVPNYRVVQAFEPAQLRGLVTAAARVARESQMQATRELPTLRRALQHPRSEVACAALLALTELGEAAVSALPDVLELLNHGADQTVAEATRQHLASRCFKALGANLDVEALVQLIPEGLWRMDHVAWNVRPLLEPSRDALRPFMSSTREEIRELGIHLAGTFLYSTPESLDAPDSPVSVLIEGTQDVSAVVRAAALYSLAEYPSVLSESLLRFAVSALSDIETRDAATAAITAVQHRAAVILPNVMRLLELDDVGVRATAAETLGAMAPFGEQSLPLLVRALKDENQLVRETAAESLVEYGWRCASVVSTTDLLQASRDALPNVRSSIATVMGLLPQKTSAVHTRLVELLDDVDADVRKATVRALGNCLEDGADAVELLVAVRAHAETEELEDLTAEANAALLRIGSIDERLVQLREEDVTGIRPPLPPTLSARLARSTTTSYASFAARSRTRSNAFARKRPRRSAS